MEEQILNEIKAIKDILNKRYDEYELLTAQEIAEESKIPYNQVLKLFRTEKKLAVQTYTKPFKITRKSWNEFISNTRI